MSDSNSFLYQYDLNDDSVHQEPTPYTSFESLFDSIPQTNDSSTDYSDDKLVNWDLFSFNGTSDLGVASPNLIDLFHDREQTANSVDPFVSVFSELTTTGMPEWTKYRGLYTDTEDSEYWTDSVLPAPFTETMPENSSPNRWRSFSESGPVIRPRRPASAPRVCSNDNCRTTVSASGWRYLQDDLNRTQPFCKFSILITNFSQVALVNCTLMQTVSKDQKIYA